MNVNEVNSFPKACRRLFFANLFSKGFFATAKGLANEVSKWHRAAEGCEDGTTMPYVNWLGDKA